jgi:hypothetical protein
MDALLSWPRPARSPAGLCAGLRATAKRGRLSQPRRGRCPAELWAAIRTGSKRGCEVSQRSQATHVTPAAVVVVATRVCRAVCAWHKVTHIRHHALGVMSRARALGRGYSRLCNDLAESSSRWHGGCGRHRTCTCVCDDPLRAAPRPHCCACGLPASPGPRCSRVLGPLSKKRRLAPRLARQALASASPSPPPTRPDKPTVPEPRANPRPLCRDRSRQPWQQPGVATAYGGTSATGAPAAAGSAPVEYAGGAGSTVPAGAGGALTAVGGNAAGGMPSPDGCPPSAEVPAAGQACVGDLTCRFYRSVDCTPEC